MNISRRSLLGFMVAAAACPQELVMAAEGKKKRRVIPWRNWSGSQQCQPAARLAPASLDELRDAVVNAPGVIRPVGAGHSFMPLVPTDGTVLSISRLSGVVRHDAAKKQATLWAGTRLGDMGAPLAEIDQAMVNMPDIDMQSLAGAMGTATHGTGAGLMCIPHYATGLQLVTAAGDVIDCDATQNSDIFEAARVSMGALGVVSQVTLQNEANYKLKRTTRFASIDEILEQTEALANENRNYEFFYLPFADAGFYDTHNYTDEAPFSTEKEDQNEAAMQLKDLRDWLSWSPALRELVLKGVVATMDDEVSVAEAWQSYASPRMVRFNEMEYHLPRENGIKAFREIREVLESDFNEVFFPIECRYVGADDVWLSPFNGRESFSIAVHRYFDEDFKPYFKALEPILKKHGGRPHWGKMNTMTGAEFAAHYPRWEDFKKIRRELDPEGKFLNPYLKSILT